MIVPKYSTHFLDAMHLTLYFFFDILVLQN